MSRTVIASMTAARGSVPSPWTSAWSRTRRSSRLTIRGVPRPRCAIRRAASGVDLDAQDARRPPDDRRQVVLAVEVEPVGHPEPVAQRAADPAGPRRGADHGERLEAEPQAARARPLADHDVEREVLHRRVEDLLDRPVEAVDLVDEQDVALVEGREDRGEVPRPLDRRPARVADVHAELAGDDRRERRLAEAGRAVEQDVIRRLSPPLRRLEQHVEARLDLALADVLVERPRTQRPLHGELAEVAPRRPRGGSGRRPSSAESSRSRARLVQMFDSRECAVAAHATGAMMAP